MNRVALMSVAFPIVVLAAWLGRLVWAQGSGTEVRLAVQGFDPRDLLAGHYLTYTVNYGPMQVCGGYDVAPERCVCLEPGSDDTHVASWAGSCSERPSSCGTYLKGECRYGRFEAEIERYYFPETYQTTLAVVPERSAIKVVVRPSGDALVTGFTVDGVDVLDYAKAQSNEQ